MTKYTIMTNFKTLCKESKLEVLLDDFYVLLLLFLYFISTPLQKETVVSCNRRFYSVLGCRDMRVIVQKDQICV